MTTEKTEYDTDQTANHESVDIKFTLFKDFYDNDVSKQGDCTWDELLNDLSKHKILENKTDAQAIAGWTFNNRRCNFDAEDIYVLILDFDGELSIPSAIRRFKKYEHLLYTTWSHGLVNKQGKDCFRMVMPLHQPMPLDQYLLRSDAMKQVGKHADPVFNKPAQIYFLPACASDNHHKAEIHHNRGELVDLWPLPENYVPIKLPARTCQSNNVLGWDPASIIESLQQHGRLEYQDWFNVGCAMHGNGFAEQDFIDATIYGMKPNRTQQQASTQWKSIVKHCESRTPYSIGVIYNVLKK